MLVQHEATFTPQTIPGSDGEPYPYHYAPTNEYGEVCGDYEGALDLAGARQAISTLPFGGMIARIREADTCAGDIWVYNWGAGWAPTEAEAVALVPSPDEWD